jgi:IclR family transcriptional regulator, pca regulon regulatory protein
MEGEQQDRGERTHSIPTLSEARYSQSLKRGLAILACFTPEQPLLGIADLAERLAMSRPTTHRYVSTLVALGCLEQDASRKYRLGLGVTHLGMAALNAMELPAHARPCMESLAKRTGRTIDLAVLDGPETLLIDRAHPAGKSASSPSATPSSRPGARRGSRQPAYCTSAGKILLAHLPAAQRSRLIAQTQIVKRAPKTITDRRALCAELQRAVEEGLAVADEELIAGACAIAAPVRAASAEVVAALSVVAPTSAITAEKLVDRFGGVLITTAERISTRLGWEDS